MNILELRIRHFGIMKNKTIVLKPGTNVINGDNETGKTTIATFVKTMLYGLSETDDDYLRFLPRESDGVFGGSMVVEDRGTKYEIIRDFTGEETKCTLVELASGTEIGNPEEEIARLLNGVTKEQFEKTAFVSEASFAEDDRAYRPTKEKREEADREQENREDFRRAKALLLKKRSAFIEKADPEVNAKLLDVKREKAENEQRVEDLTKKISESEKETEAETSDLRKLEEEVAKGNEDRRKTYEKALTDAARAWDGFRTDAEAKIRKKNTLGTALLVGALLAALAGVYYAISHRVTDFSTYRMFVVIGAAVVFAALLALGILFTVKTAKTRKQAAKDLNDETELRGRVKDAKEALDRYLADREAYDDPVPDQKKRQEEIDARLAADNVLRETLHRTEETLEALKRSESELEEKAVLDREIRKEIRAIDIAVASFDRLGNLNGTSIDPLEEGASDYYEAIVSKTGTVSLKHGIGSIRTEDGEYLFSQLSTGTKHAALFAVRLAQLDLLDGERKVPIVLDDIFTNLDENRLDSVMKYLRSAGRQVILTSCRARK